ncbi:Uncharacterised protein [BD1-7 clade bacterium]|uniref:Transposase IS200-like domain-containing protein n=1 Tax=BD1-7 clade bacterium TaxID=2029982 RepID=A0A5S9QZ37_9GAMM|nr:Uncharacterised protein [BD1-7 clade bacterium]
MTRAREQQVSLEATPYYHCVSRCVRRAFLCGGEYEHRRAWVEEKLIELAGIFCIDIAAYAVISNHYHVVFFINTAELDGLDNQSVIERWHQLFKGTVLTQRYMREDKMTNAELAQVEKCVAEWRDRLTSISWFMRVMNESIARQANQEDGCTGHFWEGRFKSQALLDDKALVACMAYVDLNPIRAKIAETPETSEHTSIKQRIDNLKSERLSTFLLLFSGSPRVDKVTGLPFELMDYIHLVDWTGRQIREDKRGYIDGAQPSILVRLDIEPEKWLIATRQFEARFKRMAGAVEYVRGAVRSMCLVRSQDVGAARVLFE